MSIDNGTCQLSFPLSGDLPECEIFVLRDVDVVGVGSLRRKQLEDLQKTNKFILKTYENEIPNSVQAIYQAELLRTLQWLRPIKQEQGGALNFVEEQKAVFAKIFPLTKQILGVAAEKLCDLYLQDMDWSSWLLQDHWRYFVGFLRRKFPDQKDLVELAHWEWVKAWLEIQPFDLTKLDPNALAVNPSLQTVHLSDDNSLLKTKKGLYAFVFNESKSSITEKQLDIHEAHLVDLAQEDRKFTDEQIVEMALLTTELPKISKEAWQTKLTTLKEYQIII